MFQDITPHHFSCDFIRREPEEHDFIVIAKSDSVLFDATGKEFSLPRYGSAVRKFLDDEAEPIYLFSVDRSAFFLSLDEIDAPEGFEYKDLTAIRLMQPSWLAFASATALHLSQWYKSRRFCGRCASPMRHHDAQRAVCCPSCGFTEYPRISPAVIVGIKDGERLLLTKYSASRYKKYALVAGFIEIGETLEDAVRREVMEEVGLQLKNIHYYKSQPWAFSQSVLMGFFADVTGTRDVQVNLEELSEASWFARREIPEDDVPLSLTWDMIETFRSGRE